MHFQPDRGFRHPVTSEITPRAVVERRRELLRWMAAGGAGAALSAWAAREAMAQSAPREAAGSALGRRGAVTMDKPTAYGDATTRNNFYEFGTDKSDPARNAGKLQTRPWTVAVEGEVGKPKVFDLDELLKLAPMEERIYRMRCVEGWSMVIPWIGWSMSELIRRVEPNGNAKFVQFETLADARQMPFVGSRVLEWPYVEGLRLDEAMHPLAMLGFGMYGEVLPNQNGAPVRMVVPWKYGFKSGKSIVRIRFTEKMPATAWNKAASHEYGFYSNVNPKVDHPRWSQATERRIGEDGLFTKKRPTLMFNGYEAQVGQLYAGMDLAKNFDVRSPLLHPLAKPAVFVAASLPFAWYLYGAFANTLGPNPAEALIRGTGDWVLRFLCLTLAVTPLRVWTGQPGLARFRRMLGLFAFFYAVLHFLAYAWLDMGFDPAAIVRDIPKRPFALVGFTAFVLMIPLAATSFNRAIKALGARRWQLLHRLVYASAVLGLLHFFWMKASKNLFGEVAVYAVVLGVLLGWRAWRRLRAPPRYGTIAA